MLHTARRAIDRLPGWFWVCILAAAAFLAVDTAITIQRVGLFGARPPLSVSQTGLRIVLLLASMALMIVRRDRVERMTLITAAAAAASSTLYGFGLRADSLSAFRLLSHQLMYVLVMIVAWQMVARRGSPSKRELVWWVPALLTLHNAEEALTLKDYLPRLPLLLPEPIASFEAQLSYPEMLIALVVLSALVTLVAVVAWFEGGRRGWWMLLAVEAAVALNVVAHLVSAVLVFHGYGPGLITALAINAPFAMYVFRRAAREQWVSPAALWATVPAALVLHGPVLLAGLWLAGRSAR